MSENSSDDSRGQQEIGRLLANAPFVRSACDLDLLVFLYRHPRTLLTNEQLATFVGYDMKQIAKSIDLFTEAGLLERTQTPIHAARMYLLLLGGRSGDGPEELLGIASTRQGRREVLRLLGAPRSNRPDDLSSRARKLRAIA